jgi:pimeloyl-ACP methyl ester carboxylesterase
MSLSASIGLAISPAALAGELVRRIVELPDHRTLACVEEGSGPAVVLLHGTLMTLEDMALGPMAALSEHYKTISIDRPGHGRSRRHRLYDASPWRQAEIIHAGLVQIGVERPVVVGHSSGGAVALAYGMLFPDDTAGVVALAPVCFPEPRLEQMLFGARAHPWLGDVLSSASAASFDPLMLSGLWQAMFLPQIMPRIFETQFPFDLARRPGQMTAEGEDALALGPGLVRSAASYTQCRVPVRILGGSADIVVNNVLHGALAARLIANAQFSLLPGAGHMFHHFQIDPIVAAIDELVLAEAF